MKRKEFSVFLVAFFLTFALLGTTQTRTVFSTPAEPRVFVDPQFSTKEPGGTFSVRINVSDISTTDSLYGWDAWMTFNASVLQVTGVARGAFLGDDTFWALGMLQPEINNTAGTVTAGDMLLDLSGQGKSGNGTLMTITFHVTISGTSPIHFDDTTLNTVKYLNPVPIPHTAVDGLFKYPVVHDIAVAGVVVSPATVLSGQTVDINVTVRNEGDFSEILDLKTYYNSSLIDSQEVTLSSGTSKNVSVSWNTAGVIAGTYEIKANATVTDDANLANNEKIDGLVRIIELPLASFTYSPLAPAVGETVTFDASSSTPNGGSIAIYRWDFGDDTDPIEVDVPTTTHSYSAGGSYTVTLNVTDTEDLWDTETKSITVGTPPVASFTYMPANPLINELVAFDASASTPDGGTIQSYQWDFGDGTPIETVTDPMAPHVYTASGVFNVTLTVINSEGLNNTMWKLIRIRENPVALFTFDPEEPLSTQEVTFDASNSRDEDGAITTYAWNFGDGTTGTGETVDHAYTKAGTYTVTLTVTDNDGLTDVASTDIQIFVHDVAINNVELSPSTVQIGANVTISVIVANKGNFSQTFDVSVYCNSTKIETQAVALAAGATKTLTFTWNTKDAVAGVYTVRAEAPAVPDETDTANNTRIDGTVTLNEPESPSPLADYYLYIAAAVVIIVIAVVAIYLLKTRR